MPPHSRQNTTQKQYLANVKRRPILDRLNEFYKDSDKDLVLNALDCYPYNPSRHKTYATKGAGGKYINPRAGGVSGGVSGGGVSAPSKVTTPSVGVAKSVTGTTVTFQAGTSKFGESGNVGLIQLKAATVPSAGVAKSVTGASTTYQAGTSTFGQSGNVGLIQAKPTPTITKGALPVEKNVYKIQTPVLQVTATPVGGVSYLTAQQKASLGMTTPSYYDMITGPNILQSTKLPVLPKPTPAPQETFVVPKKYWGTSSKQYGLVSETGKQSLIANIPESKSYEYQQKIAAQKIQEQTNLKKLSAGVVLKTGLMAVSPITSLYILPTEFAKIGDKSITTALKKTGTFLYNLPGAVISKVKPRLQTYTEEQFPAASIQYMQERAPGYTATKYYESLTPAEQSLVQQEAMEMQKKYQRDVTKGIKEASDAANAVVSKKVSDSIEPIVKKKLELYGVENFNQLPQMEQLFIEELGQGAAEKAYTTAFESELKKKTYKFQPVPGITTKYSAYEYYQDQKELYDLSQQAKPKEFTMSWVSPQMQPKTSVSKKMVSIIIPTKEDKTSPEYKLKQKEAEIIKKYGEKPIYSMYETFKPGINVPSSGPLLKRELARQLAITSSEDVNVLVETTPYKLLHPEYKPLTYTKEREEKYAQAGWVGKRVIEFMEGTKILQQNPKIAKQVAGAVVVGTGAAILSSPTSVASGFTTTIPLVSGAYNLALGQSSFLRQTEEAVYQPAATSLILKTFTGPNIRPGINEYFKKNAPIIGSTARLFVPGGAQSFLINVNQESFKENPERAVSSLLIGAAWGIGDIALRRAGIKGLEWLEAKKASTAQYVAVKAGKVAGVAYKYGLPAAYLYPTIKQYSEAPEYQKPQIMSEFSKSLGYLTLGSSSAGVVTGGFAKATQQRQQEYGFRLMERAGLPTEGGLPKNVETLLLTQTPSKIKKLITPSRMTTAGQAAKETFTGVGEAIKIKTSYKKTSGKNIENPLTVFATTYKKLRTEQVKKAQDITDAYISINVARGNLKPVKTGWDLKIAAGDIYKYVPGYKSKAQTKTIIEKGTIILPMKKGKKFSYSISDYYAYKPTQQMAETQAGLAQLAAYRRNVPATTISPQSTYYESALRSARQRMTDLKIPKADYQAAVEAHAKVLMDTQLLLAARSGGSASQAVYFTKTTEKATGYKPGDYDLAGNPIYTKLAMIAAISKNKSLLNKAGINYKMQISGTDFLSQVYSVKKPSVLKNAISSHSENVMNSLIAAGQPGLKSIPAEFGIRMYKSSEATGGIKLAQEQAQQASRYRSIGTEPKDVLKFWQVKNNEYLIRLAQAKTTTERNIILNQYNAQEAKLQNAKLQTINALKLELAVNKKATVEYKTTAKEAIKQLQPYWVTNKLKAEPNIIKNVQKEISIKKPATEYPAVWGTRKEYAKYSAQTASNLFVKLGKAVKTEIKYTIPRQIKGIIVEHKGRIMPSTTQKPYTPMKAIQSMITFQPTTKAYTTKFTPLKSYMVRSLIGEYPVKVSTTKYGLVKEQKYVPSITHKYPIYAPKEPKYAENYYVENYYVGDGGYSDGGGYTPYQQPYQPPYLPYAGTYPGQYPKYQPYSNYPNYGQYGYGYKPYNYPYSDYYIEGKPTPGAMGGLMFGEGGGGGALKTDKGYKLKVYGVLNLERYFAKKKSAQKLRFL